MSATDVRAVRSDSERAPAGPSTALAEVVALDAAGCWLRLRTGERVLSRVAVRGYRPTSGDRVLVTIDDDGAPWVIGVAQAAPATPLLDETLLEETLLEQAPLEETLLESVPHEGALLANGAASEQAEPTQRVHDKRGALLFEYDAANDRAVLHVPSGDLELQVPEGAMRLHARDGLVLESESDVEVRGGRTVTLSAESDASTSSVRLQPGELSLVGSVITAAADRAELLAHTATVRALDLESHAERLRTVAKVVDVRAGRIVERARDVYREVERLSQTRAGKLRLVAQRAAQIVGENTLIKARDRMKIRGERIHLA